MATQLVPYHRQIEYHSKERIQESHHMLSSLAGHPAAT